MKEAIKIIKKLQDAGHYALLVGGCVRDFHMGVEPKDYDIVTSAMPEQVEALFKNTIPVGKQFGVILVNKNYEIATFRQDNYEGENLTVNLLDPETHSLEELVSKDAHKRDFTCNAIYHDPISNQHFDPVNGKRDLVFEDRLTFIGSPTTRIEEDPIRILRFFRFIFKYPFLQVRLSEKQICVRERKQLLRVSKERIFAETTNILLNLNTWNEEYFEDFLTYILGEVISPIREFGTTDQSKVHHPEKWLSNHTFYALKALRVKTEVTVWATLLHDVGKVRDTKVEEDGRITAHGHDNTGAIMAEEILRDLKCSNDFIKEVTYIVKNHMRIKWAIDMRKGKVIKLIKDNYYENLLEVSCADSMGAKGNLDWYHWIINFEKSDRCPDGPLVKPLVTGRDLIERGLEPGVTFKVLLKKAFDLQLEDETLTKEEILLDIFS